MFAEVVAVVDVELDGTEELVEAVVLVAAALAVEDVVVDASAPVAGILELEVPALGSVEVAVEVVVEVLVVVEVVICISSLNLAPVRNFFGINPEQESKMYSSWFIRLK